MGMKRQQGPLWKTHDTTLRITKLERPAVEDVAADAEFLRDVVDGLAKGE
jgi:hypothetical protein